ncbi:MAG: ATP-grasp domain-containing protein [Inquilinus sp.]|uniref:ATP-grasp domain-containing protein n=1 Tax=Inquilinus sp. TaxID=1932117 RepID=UPI003F411798
MHICLLGDPEDLAAIYVGWIARQSGCAVLELPEGALGTAWEYELDDSGRGTLRVGNTEMRWETVAGVFVRMNPEPPLPPGLTLNEEHRLGFLHERREGLHQLLEHLRCAVVNRPSAGRSNASKPYQMAELEAAGFDVPRWIASNSAEAVRAFTTEAGGHAIYKASSGLRSRVRRVDAQLMERLHAGSTPTVVQEYVPGIDVRVHTVERCAFACAVSSEGVDYRFEHRGTCYERTSIPDGLAEQCCAFAEASGLVLAGFDFRRTPNGEYRCLEMNPVPSFLPYEIPSGLPIGAAVVQALTRQRERS